MGSDEYPASVWDEGWENQVYEKHGTAYLDADAVRHNVEEIRHLTEKRLIAVVKENGYGLGLANLYKSLRACGVDFFAVFSCAEAMALRRIGWTGALLLLGPEFSVERLIRLMDSDVILMTGSEDQAALLHEAAAASGLQPRIHLKIDTGLGRFGFSPDEFARLADLLDGFRIEGCYTHFSAEGRQMKRLAAQQTAAFRQALTTLQAMGIPVGMTHAASSKVLTGMGDLGFDAVRAGSLLLGRGCYYDAGARFQDAVWLESGIVSVAQRRKGDSIGYGNGERLRRDTRVGLILAGHGDGVCIGYTDYTQSRLQQAVRLLRPATCRRPVIEWQGRPLPILGAIGLNHIAVDLTDCDAQAGDTVRIPVNPLLLHTAVPRRVRGRGFSVPDRPGG